MAKVTHYALNQLPSSENLEIGGIYFLNDGTQYVVNSSKAPIKISDIVFTDTLAQFGALDKLYVHTDNNTSETTLKIWNGLEYTNVGGDEVDLSEIENAITTLQSANTELQGKVATNTSNISTIDGKVTLIETKISELETEIDNLSTVDLTQLQTNVNNNTTNIATNTNNIADLTTQLSPIPSQITDLDTRLDTIEGKKKTTNILILTNDVTIGIKPYLVDVPYSSSITNVKAILSNDSGTQVDYSIEKSTDDGETWTSVVDGNVSVGNVISTTTSSSTLNANELLRLVVNSNNEDVNGLTVNITIEEQ